MSSKILVLPGDGIGVEVADQAIRVIDKLNEQGLDASYEKELVGGASYDANGEPLTPAVLEKAKNSDAILLGAVGGSKWDDVERSKRPEAGLLGLRKELELFANLNDADNTFTAVDFLSNGFQIINTSNTYNANTHIVPTLCQMLIKREKELFKFELVSHLFRLAKGEEIDKG